MRFIQLSGFVVFLALNYAVSANADDSGDSIVDSADELAVPQSALDYVRHGQLDKAIPAYRDVVRSNPKSALSHHSLGALLLAAGRADEAIPEFQEAVRLQPNEWTFRRSLAFGYWKAVQFDKCIGEFETVLRNDPQCFEAYTELAFIYLRSRHYPKAIQYFTSSLEIEDASRARLGRAVALFRSGLYISAIDDCDAILKVDSQTQQAYAYRAFASFRQGNLEEAERDSRRALEITDGNSEATAQLVLGCVLLHQGDTDAGIKHLTKAIQLLPNEPLPYVIRAITELQRLEPKSAIADVDEAIRISGGPEKPNFMLDGYAWLVYKLRGLCVLMYEFNNPAAVNDFSEAIAINPADTDSYVLRGMAHSNQSEWQEAFADYKKAIAISPKHELALLVLSEFLASCPQDELRDGIHALELAGFACRQTNWKYPELVQVFAAAHAETGDYANAVMWQQRAIEQTADRGSDHSYRIQLWWNSHWDLSIVVTQQEATNRLEKYRRGQPYRLKSGAILGARIEESHDQISK